MQRYLPLLIGLCLNNSTQAFADFTFDKTPFVSIGLVAGTTSASHTSQQPNNGSGFPPPADIDKYTINHDTVSPGIRGSLAYQWTRSATWLPKLELSARYQYLHQHPVHGDIWQFNLPTFINYGYRMRLSSHSVMAVAKMVIAHKKFASPFVSVGLGGVANHLHQYQETPRPGVTARVSPGFKTNINTHITYAIGAGVDIAATNSMSLTIAYEYNPQGTLTSANGIGNWSGERLNFGTVNAQFIALTLNYHLDANS